MLRYKIVHVLWPFLPVGRLKHWGLCNYSTDGSIHTTIHRTLCECQRKGGRECVVMEILRQITIRGRLKPILLSQPLFIQVINQDIFVKINVAWNGLKINLAIQSTLSSEQQNLLKEMLHCTFSSFTVKISRWALVPAFTLFKFLFKIQHYSPR